jgi:glutathione S-transferase
MAITLYYHPLASFCHKVLIALYEHSIDFEKRLIDLGDEADRAALQALWQIGKFPVIRDHARARDVPESSIIIEYLDHFYPGAAPLLPLEWEAAHDVRLWDRFFDNYVQGPMNAIVIDRITGLKGDMARERAALATAYAMIEERMASRQWIAGDSFSMADCAAAPALFYAATLVPFADHASHLEAYFERLMARPSVHRVLEEAKPYFSMYPFEEAIPAHFR